MRETVLLFRYILDFPFTFSKETFFIKPYTMKKLTIILLLISSISLANNEDEKKESELNRINKEYIKAINNKKLTRRKYRKATEQYLKEFINQAEKLVK